MGLEPTAADGIYRDHVSGVVASGASSTTSGCRNTWVFLYARKDQVTYERVVDDHCTGQRISWINGYDVPTTFERRGNLDSVRVVATLATRDLANGNLPADPVLLDDTFIATSPAEHTTSSYREVLPGQYVILMSGVGLGREAVATGTVPLPHAFIGAGSSLYIIVTVRPQPPQP